jgi:tetratricopeptide (TPR) repeat protein
MLRRSALMLRHIALIGALAAVALACGIGMVPGEREQWTMLVRDGRNQEALALLQARYDAGQREPDAVLNLYRLYMGFAEIGKATRVIQEFAAANPGDAQRTALLAKHYADIQDRPNEVRTLEALFDLQPSVQTARELLAHYRLAGEFAHEQRLLRTLLAQEMITANDAERLGLILVAQGDLYGAREALIRFDEIANPERTIGRFVLFDVLVQTGDSAGALSRAVSWIAHFRKVGVHRGGAGEAASARLIRMMLAVDEAEARRLLCDLDEQQTSALGRAHRGRGVRCDLGISGAQSEAEALGTSITHAIAPDEPPRRRRR